MKGRKVQPEVGLACTRLVYVSFASFMKRKSERGVMGSSYTKKETNKQQQQNLNTHVYSGLHLIPLVDAKINFTFSFLFFCADYEKNIEEVRYVGGDDSTISLH